MDSALPYRSLGTTRSRPLRLVTWDHHYTTPIEALADTCLAITHTQSMFAFQLVYVVAAYLCKVSVALVLIRISGTDRKSLIRKILIASIVIVTIFSVATFITLALQCRPVTLNWGVGKGECVAPHVITDIAYAFSAADIASNWLYAVSSPAAQRSASAFAFPFRSLFESRLTLQRHRHYRL
jgi:hypothetical protein